jgi:predicted porin
MVTLFGNDRNRNDQLVEQASQKGTIAMKKTLLATAIAAAMAASGAQAATVYNQEGTKLDIYGNIQIAYYDTDDAILDEDGVFTGVTDTDNTLTDNGTTFGFRAEHVITSGLTGYLTLEIDDFDATEMATFDRSNQTGDTAFVGMRGNFGDVRLGSYDQLIDDWIQDPIASNEGFDHTDSTTIHGRGGDQQTDKLTYTSPTWSGLQFALGTQWKGSGETNNATLGGPQLIDGEGDGSGNAAFFGGVKYTTGPFSIAAVYDDLDNIVDASGSSVGDAYGITAQYTIDTLRLSAKYERFDGDSDIAGAGVAQDTDHWGLGARYGYGMGDVYASYQFVDFDAGSFRSNLATIIDPDEELEADDNNANEFIIGVNYDISDAMYVWTEAAWYDRDGDDGDGIGVGVTYLF